MQSSDSQASTNEGCFSSFRYCSQRCLSWLCAPRRYTADLFICEWMSLIQNTFLIQVMVVIKVNLLSENVGQDGRTCLRMCVFFLAISLVDFPGSRLALPPPEKPGSPSGTCQGGDVIQGHNQLPPSQTSKQLARLVAPRALNRCR